MSFLFSKENTVNQLLFRDSHVINWFVASNFRDRSFFIDMGLPVMYGSRREILATMRLPRTLQKFLAPIKSWFTVGAPGNDIKGKIEARELLGPLGFVGI
jgi:hypothetical protein